MIETHIHTYQKECSAECRMEERKKSQTHWEQTPFGFIFPLKYARIIHMPVKISNEMHQFDIVRWRQRQASCIYTQLTSFSMVFATHIIFFGSFFSEYIITDPSPLKFICIVRRLTPYTEYYTHTLHSTLTSVKSFAICDYLPLVSRKKFIAASNKWL